MMPSSPSSPSSPSTRSPHHHHPHHHHYDDDDHHHLPHDYLEPCVEATVGILGAVKHALQLCQHVRQDVDVVRPHVLAGPVKSTEARFWTAHAVGTALRTLGILEQVAVGGVDLGRQAVPGEARAVGVVGAGLLALVGVLRLYHTRVDGIQKVPRLLGPVALGIGSLADGDDGDDGGDGGDQEEEEEEQEACDDGRLDGVHGCLRHPQSWALAVFFHFFNDKELFFALFNQASLTGSGLFK